MVVGAVEQGREHREGRAERLLYERTEGEALGVKVSVVCPGFVESNIYTASEAVNVPRETLAARIPFRKVPAAVAAERHALVPEDADAEPADLSGQMQVESGIVDQHDRVGPVAPEVRQDARGRFTVFGDLADRGRQTGHMEACEVEEA